MKIKQQYFSALLLLSLTACKKESAVNDCLCTISLNGNTWSQYNVSNCDLCNAPQGYSANYDCD